MNNRTTIQIKKEVLDPQPIVLSDSVTGASYGVYESQRLNTQRATDNQFSLLISPIMCIQQINKLQVRGNVRYDVRFTAYTQEMRQVAANWMANKYSTYSNAAGNALRLSTHNVSYLTFRSIRYSVPSFPEAVFDYGQDALQNRLNQDNVISFTLAPNIAAELDQVIAQNAFSLRASISISPSQQSAVDVQISSSSGVEPIDPIGRIIMWYFSPTNIPSNHLVCDGSEITNLTRYQKLVDLLGRDANGRVFLPDLRGRTVIGSGQSTGLSNYSLGQTGGVEQVTLTRDQMPAHNHGGVTGAGNKAKYIVVYQAGTSNCHWHVNGWAGGAPNHMRGVVDGRPNSIADAEGDINYPLSHHTHNITSDGEGEKNDILLCVSPRYMVPQEVLDSQPTELFDSVTGASFGVYESQRLNTQRATDNQFSLLRAVISPILCIQQINKLQVRGNVRYDVRFTAYTQEMKQLAANWLANKYSTYSQQQQKQQQQQQEQQQGGNALRLNVDNISNLVFRSIRFAIPSFPEAVFDFGQDAWQTRLNQDNVISFTLAANIAVELDQVIAQNAFSMRASLSITPPASSIPSQSVADVQISSSIGTTTTIINDPIGKISMWSLSLDVIPSNYLVCDGREITNQPRYKKLADLLGPDTTNGRVFLPDLRGRTVIGSGSGQSTGLSNYSLGQTGGVEQVTLTRDQMPAHNHGGVTGAGNKIKYIVVHHQGNNNCHWHVNGWDGGAHHAVGQIDNRPNSIADPGGDTKYPMSHHTHNIASDGDINKVGTRYCIKFTAYTQEMQQIAADWLAYKYSSTYSQQQQQQGNDLKLICVDNISNLPFQSIRYSIPSTPEAVFDYGQDTKSLKNQDNIISFLLFHYTELDLLIAQNAFSMKASLSIKPSSQKEEEEEVIDIQITSGTPSLGCCATKTVSMDIPLYKVSTLVVTNNILNQNNSASDLRVQTSAAAAAAAAEIVPDGDQGPAPAVQNPAIVVEKQDKKYDRLIQLNLIFLSFITLLVSFIAYKHLNGPVIQTQPIGTIEQWYFSLADVPSNYLVCNGTEIIDNVRYKDLVILLGKDANGRSFLPDLRGRAIIGSGKGNGLSNYNHRQTGGEEQVTLTKDQMPEHNHGGVTGPGNKAKYIVVHQAGTSNDAYHVNGWAGGPNHMRGAVDNRPNSISDPEGDTQYPGSIHTHNIKNDGKNQPHNNMQPYIALHYIIKAQ
ncbi:hypothetical protein DFA_10208 [Cavenderia fasciculata]|uniref:Phage tail collar domain-containing protein n=1 Tax=Cavenderia fasciculata TaxID=261658 RepID=F4Q9K5_CACFS|nr:uncharacterized protein DFA_10208 [Cavenderia fasciculata]EGG15374.1 hypothetical protein DFA_10208 [Cavenderia fasciculata]|eukprot:XP_004354116.1 hypothetical protein DFA_10208 [Cavenderia fasciculata]